MKVRNENMAYGNWGAFVYKNGERQKQREDNAPFYEEELTPGYYQAFGGNDEKGNRLSTGKNLYCVHASLGNGRLRLCGYKNSPMLFIDGKEVDIDSYKKGLEIEGRWDNSYEGEIDGYSFKVNQYDGNMVDLVLIEPDGTKWTSTCGYEYGSGHME